MKSKRTSAAEDRGSKVRTKPERAAKITKRSASITRSKVKGMTKRVAKAAAVAEGLAAIDTVLAGLSPGEKPSGRSSDAEEKH